MTRPAAITHPQKEENNEEKLSRYSWRALSSGRNFYTIILEGGEPHFFSPQLANVWVSFVDGELAGAGAVVGAGVAAVHKVGGVLVGGLTARHDDCRRGHTVSYSRALAEFGTYRHSRRRSRRHRGRSPLPRAPGTRWQPGRFRCRRKRRRTPGSQNAPPRRARGLRNTCDFY